MQWVEIGISIALAVLGVTYGLLSWSMRRELNRNDEDHSNIWEAIGEVRGAIGQRAHADELVALRQESDSRFKTLDQDIKNTGQKLGDTLRVEISGMRNEMAAQTARLDQIILHFSAKD